MLLAIHPKLPMRDKNITLKFYQENLGFERADVHDYDGYLMLKKDQIELHFFEHRDLNVNENYGQVYIRTDAIKDIYASLLDNQVAIHPNGALQTKPWGQLEFSILDPDNNLITFGQAV
ncbi:MAG TPA: VOC family protein [Flavobacterium lutivivi]|nr:VOC family protein [Flavobacterium lutivivi]